MTYSATVVQMLLSSLILRHTNPEVLESATREIVKVFERAGCNARIERMNNLEAFLGSLPGHGYENVRKPLITSFNFVDLVPLSNDWIGEQTCPCPFYPPNSPALLQAATAGSTPFSLNLHTGDVGHTLILGPTGSGKSTLLATIAFGYELRKNRQSTQGGSVPLSDEAKMPRRQSLPLDAAD